MPTNKNNIMFCQQTRLDRTDFSIDWWSWIVKLNWQFQRQSMTHKCVHVKVSTVSVWSVDGVRAKCRSVDGVRAKCRNVDSATFFINNLVAFFVYILFPVFEGQFVVCSVFWPANGCSTCRSLVKAKFMMLNQLFQSLTKENKEKRKQNSTKTCNKRGVYQRLGVTLKCWFTPKSWSTPEGNVKCLSSLRGQ